MTDAATFGRSLASTRSRATARYARGRRTGCEQSAVSHQVRRLEDFLGRATFETT